MSGKVWTKAEDDSIRACYADEATSVLAKRLGRTASSVYQRARKLGLLKSADYLASPAACRLRRGDSVGAAHKFKKGHKPWNAGLKGWSAGGRAKETQFRKGNTPHTWVPVGTEAVDPDGYLKVKVSEPNVWEWKHRLNWAAAHGPIQDGMIVVFKTADRINCDPSNLELIDRAELMRRNTVHRYPAELKHTIRVVKKLQRMIEDAHEKQN